MKTFVMGDIHGNHLALKQCLQRSEFNYKEDLLIQLGDICDGWSHVYECFEELDKISNKILIRGNHDKWFADYLECGIHSVKWNEGAVATAKSYLRVLGKEDGIKFLNKGYGVSLNPGDVPTSHFDMLRSQVNYYKDEKNRLFTHGGFNRHLKLKDQREDIFYWDRDLWLSVLAHENTPNKRRKSLRFVEQLEEIFIGHTSTTNWNSKEEVTLFGIILLKGEPKTDPMHVDKIWNLDTGAGGRNGKLTIMNVDSKQYWQSDLCGSLYPEEKGRY